MFLRKYATGTGADVIIPIIKRGVVDFAVTADWTPASGDVKVSLDGGAEANIATLPVINGTTGWKFVFSNAELTCKQLTVRIVDSATKAIEDQFFIVETYGHASAMFVYDFSVATQPVNATQFAGQTITAAAGVTIPSSIASPTNITAGTITTTTNLTNLPSIPANWITTAGITDGALTAAKFASGAFDAVWTVTTRALSATGVAAIWNALTSGMVTSGSIAERILAVPTAAQNAAAVDVALINTGDGSDLLQAIANQIAADWVAGDASPLAIVTAMKSDATIAQMIARIDAAMTSRLAAASYTVPPSAAANAEAVWDEGRSGHVTPGTFGEKVLAELNSATQTQIDNIETFATRVTTGIVQDGAVWQFTANMLELGPSGGGGSTVNVLPATGIVADRSAGTTLLPVIGETISQAITVYQSDGTTAVDLSGKTLAIIFETMSKVDVAIVNASDITISGTDDNIVTFAYPLAVTASERTLRFAIRDAAAPLTMYLQGICSVVSAPKVDT